jgi:uncharacterized protein (DUF2062 family)
MKHCIVIPCYDHGGTVAAVARAAREHGPVIVVDDGSSAPLPDLPGCTVLRLESNHGKGAALRAGFRAAAVAGYTHAITMDADGQHFAEDLPGFIAAAQANPRALLVGVRNLAQAGAPGHRQCSNAVSTFWFKVETGVRLGDTQCGFRCYPLDLAQRLKTRSERYAFELEFMVRASWTGVPIVAMPVRCIYRPEHMRQSHFRPVVDLARITTMNIGLVIQSWVIPQALRARRSLGEHQSFRRIVRDFFAENSHEPARLAGAVGLGLFCGIAPIWGFQMLVAGTLAHLLRLNKAITLLASNVSVWPLTPFVLYSGLAVGHWLFAREALGFSPHQMTVSRAFEYASEWIVGSLMLGAAAAAAGMSATYCAARLWRHR